MWLAGDSTLDNKAREPSAELVHYMRFRALQCSAGCDVQRFNSFWQAWLFPGNQSVYAVHSDALHGVFTKDAVNGYEACLEPPTMVCDVC